MDARATPQRRSLSARLIETVRLYGPLGFTAFGGPSANIVAIRKIFVDQEQWVDDGTFNDLLALGNALPGPAFSQLAFSISALRGGTLAAMLSFVLLTAPGAIIMIGLGFAVRKIPDTLPPIVFALFTGLNAAALGLVCLAAHQLSGKVVTDPATRLLVFFSGAIASCYESQWLYPVLMVAGGLTTFTVDFAQQRRDKARRAQAAPGAVTGSSDPTAEGVNVALQVPAPAARANSTATTAESTTRLLRRTTTGESRTSQRYPTPPLDDSNGGSFVAAHEDSEAQPQQEPVYFSLSIRGGCCIAVAFFISLIVLLVVRGTVTHHRELDFTADLVLAGTLIFGGGPVVIPLLRGFTVDPGWITPRDFLLGFAFIQAMPGPMFNFAGFLGVLVIPAQPILGGLLGVIAIFLPGIALKLAALPLYTRWRTSKITRSILRGLNAAAVGLIYSAVYRLFRVGLISAHADPSIPAMFTSLDRDGFWVSTVAASFVACGSFGVPTPLAILGGAVGGVAYYGVKQA